MSVKCQNCGVENVDNAKYCCECGNELGFYCRKCGVYNRNGKFCINCGTKNEPVDWNNASTSCHDYSWDNVYKDESGTYTADRLVFLEGNYNAKKIEIRRGTRVICDDALVIDQIFEYAIVEEIIIPGSVTQIGESAFACCINLQSIVIPDSVTQIGEAAFKYCEGLQSIVISDSVTQIGIDAFLGCKSLQSIMVSEGNTIYDSRNNCNAIIETESDILVAGCSQTVVPDSVTQIGEAAFMYCESLQSIVIPNSVTQIGKQAFWGCKSLQSIVIPDSVTQIEYCTFSFCSSLQSIVIPDSVTQIGERVFWDCISLQTIVIPDSVTQIGSEAFRDCKSLQSICIPKGTIEKFKKLIDPKCHYLIEEV